MAQKKPISPEKSKVAKSKFRDQDGHFLSEEEAIAYLKDQKKAAQILNNHIHKATNDDDLLDIHVGNPLRKITTLLEDLKKQKAFSFTLKGSLGIMGVFLSLSVFGILGGGKILCDKGVQTHIGTIRTLQVLEHDSKDIPYLQNLIEYLSPTVEKNRVILIKSDYSSVTLPYSRFVDLNNYDNAVVIATGQFDSCSQRLTVKDPKAIELFQ
ncbi:hypothetical protein KBD81_00625 [Candidatus Woesebacteria bacterium]|nr:hypothetical protein [Candidatus Woesebacteria bacterium]